jgi:hypothetical protein
VILAAAVLISAFSMQSCKKPVHPTHPTPSNYRVLSYTKLTTDMNGGVVNENYRFFYNSDNRVSQIIYTSNDSTPTGFNKTSTFTYFNDTIVKKTTYVKTTLFVELDTFLENSQHFITTAFTPGTTNTFEYFGKLLSRRTEQYYKDYAFPDPTFKFTNVYHSNNIDFLNNESGTLSVEFQNLATPMDVIWTATTFQEKHTISTLSDQLTRYMGDSVQIDVTDKDGKTVHRTYPGATWLNQSFKVYPDLANRPGDFMQIGSFTMYGANLYQNNHLVKQIGRLTDTTDIRYDIDADSKITQTNVLVRDLLGRTLRTEVYKLQYETYQ